MKSGESLKKFFSFQSEKVLVSLLYDFVLREKIFFGGGSVIERVFINFGVEFI
jgi:hypothetical protein